MSEDFDIENASRDELVAFYNDNKPEDGEALSVASSKDAARTAVEALLAAEADGSVEEAAAEATAEAVEAFEGTAPEEAAAAEDDEPDEEPDDDPDPDEADEEDESLEEEEEEAEPVDCDMCGGAGLMPRCPTCGTERRSV